MSSQITIARALVRAALVEAARQSTDAIDRVAILAISPDAIIDNVAPGSPSTAWHIGYDRLDDGRLVASYVLPVQSTEAYPPVLYAYPFMPAVDTEMEQEEIELPKLPKPDGLRRKMRADGGYDMLPCFSADQMRDYASAALMEKEK